MRYRYPSLACSRREAVAAAIAVGLGLGGGSAGAQRRAESAADMPVLAGKTALVTGSTDGLGREVALRLGALGATVIGVSYNRHIQEFPPISYDYQWLFEGP